MKSRFWLSPRGKRSRGFSLIELLVVIAIIAALIALLFPAIQYARATARRATSQANLRNIALAILNYETQNGHLPVAGRLPGDNVPRVGWMTNILPQLDRRDLYERYDFKKDWFDPANLPVTSTRLPVLIDPASPQADRLDGRPEAFAQIVGVTDYASVRSVDARLFNGTGGSSGGGSSGGTPGVDGPNPGGTGITAGANGIPTGGTYASTQTLGAYVNAYGVGAMPPNVKARMAEVTDGFSRTILLAESHARPYLYRRGKKISDDLNASRVNGGGWSRNANDIRLVGFSRDGVMPVGPFGINAANGVDVGSDGGGSAGQAPNWGTGQTATDGSGSIYSFHVGGAHVAFGDAAVKFLNEKIDIAVLAALVTRDQNELYDEYLVDNPK